MMVDDVPHGPGRCCYGSQHGAQQMVKEIAEAMGMEKKANWMKLILVVRRILKTDGCLVVAGSSWLRLPPEI